MKTKIRNVVTILFFFMSFGWKCMSSLCAQTFATDVIGSAGTFATSTGGSMAWTIGEVMIETYSSSVNFFTQGFHQPDKKAIVSVVDFFIPEGFSPNGDFINDLFVIRGILNYPNNKFVIFNRWGEKLFEASPYKNTWNGKSTSGLRIGGDELPTGTYFYLLDLNDGSKIFKGTIYLNK